MSSICAAWFADDERLYQPRGQGDRLSPAGSRHRQLLRPDQVDCEQSGHRGRCHDGAIAGSAGVVNETESDSREPSDELTRETLTAVEDALKCLNRMREVEGANMATELLTQIERIRVQKDAIEEKAPLVIDDYRERLRLRVQQGLSLIGAEVHPSDLLRETQIFADKADVREEIVRLRSHTRQFAALLDEKESQGRKLDFLIQEMFREANTIGSKAGDSEIAQRVVDIKAIIEQMRELVQNVE